MSAECGLPGQKLGNRHARNADLLPALLLAGSYDPSHIQHTIWSSSHIFKINDISSRSPASSPLPLHHRLYHVLTSSGCSCPLHLAWQYHATLLLRKIIQFYSGLVIGVKCSATITIFSPDGCHLRDSKDSTS